MDDNRIEIVASLDIPKTVSTIEKDLEEVKKRLDANKALSIACSLDTNSLATLQNQVSEISKKLKIDIPKIEIQAGTGQSTQNIENIAQSVETVTNKVLTLKKTLADLDKKLVEPFEAITDDGIINAERTLSVIQSKLSSLGTVTVKGYYNDVESADSINKIIARIEAASGEVRELNFLLDGTGKRFDYIGGSYSDKGVVKVQQDLARLSKELANFEASHKSIESGLIEPLTVARNAIIDLESGVGSVESAQKALDNLKTSAAEIGINLKSTGSSFNVFDNASNKAKNFDNIIKGLELDINNLNQESNKSNLSNSLDEARQKLQQLQNVESQFGKGVEWSKNYKEVSELLQTIANDLKVVQREEKKAFQDDNRVANLQNRIKRLTADVNAYGEANERATKSMRQMSNGKTFAVEWSRITAEMAKGVDLTDGELKDLSADMAVFRKEAQAAGLAGESAWGKFLNSFKTMSSYITANTVFNFVKRQLRDMVNEVTAIDTAMTELRKVTEATNAEFEAFAKSAGQTGRELGASISDVINATSTFSRAGYNLPDAEELGKIATLYKNVGDGINIDTASESIISVMKAFNIEAENSIGIIDRINEVSNRAAIDSGGLGLALQRVASAMDAANNSLDETIALTTSANEVVQNPEMVAQGWRTVALRIRGAKSELEDAGLETDGMVESTAKLRDLIKGISGVDIMLDENTFKSTYQIIDEIGKVWKNIKDVDQASLLEAIAGKRQSNIVAATLNNYERLEEILEISQNSAGSAMREQEEYAKSIQYSLDTLKAAYQDFSQTVIESDFVKNLLSTAQSFLEVLTKIIDKFGTLPTLLTSIAAVGSFKGVGIFGSDISQFVNGFKRLSGEIDNYNHSVNRTKYVQRAFSEEMGGTNASLNKYLKGLNGTQASFKGYITSLVTARLKTVALEVATAALNATITFGLSLALGKIVEAMDEWIHAEEKAAEEAKELRETGHSAVEEITKETESLSEVAQKYIELYSSTSDINTAKEELSNLQDDLIEKYGKEAEGIDLVNGKLSDQLEEIRQIKKEEAESFIFNSDNKKRYQQALNSLKGTKEDERIANADSTQFFRAKISAKSTKELSNLLKLFSDTGVSYDKIVTDTFGKEADIAIMGDLESQVNGWKKLADVYKEIDGYNQDVYDSLMQQYVLAKEKYDIDKADADEFERQSKYYNSFDVPQDVLNSYNSLIDKAAELNSIINGDYSVSEKLKASDDLEDIHHQLNTIAKDYIPLQDDIKTTFASFNDSISNSIQSVGDLREEWFKSLNDMQKGSLKNIDTMKSALQSVMNGENISSDTFWQLAEFDTDHILNGVKMVGDEFQLTEEQIISLKDTYIKKQMESIQLRQTELKQLKSAEEMEARQLQVALDNWKFADKNLNNPKYRAEFEDLQNRLKTAKGNAAAYGDEWSLNAILLRQYNASLGNTADLIQAAQSQAGKLSEAFVGRIDKVINGINDQKDALTEEKEVLQDQLDILEAQADEIKGIIEDYEKVADIVKETIEEEISAIEETYNKQIEALKAQNEEREEAINLTEKLNNLNNAKNNKVVTYTEAGGFQYGVNKEAVNKAQQEYDKALIDSQIAKLEKERDSATAGFEEYAKLWENATKKATKAEEEELAARILGADWREKISEQDVEIFETYEQKYDEYGVSLNNITNIEIANVKKSIEAKDKEIKAKEDLLKEWQKYKTNVQNYVNDLKNTNKEYEDSIENITLTENSNLDERLANFKRFKGEYESMINRILELQGGVGDFTDGIKEVVEGIGTVSEKLAETIKELGKMPSINSAGDVKYYQAAGYQHYASGGVNSSTGLAWLDGTRSKPELVLNNQDATKLYNLLHSMPVSDAQMFSSPLTRFAGLRSGNTSQSSAITITGTTINLPNVRDPQQFAREMERYLQTTLTESQIMPPRS